MHNVVVQNRFIGFKYGEYYHHVRAISVNSCLVKENQDFLSKMKI